MTGNRRDLHSKYSGEGKGYVLSLDALMALLILITFIGAAGFSFLQESGNVIAKGETKKVMDDTMDVLDRENVLEGLDVAIIEEKINSSLPKNIFWKVKIEEFEYSQNNFTLRNTYSLGDTTTSLADIEFVKGRRLFLTFEDREILRFYNLEYWAWSEGI